MKKLIVMSLLFALALTGCLGRGSGRQEFKSLVYTVTGGIAGLDQRLNVTADGTYQIAEKGRQGKAGRLTAAELKAVRDLAARVDWPALQEQYVDARVADAVFEGVTVQQGKKTYKTVVGTGGQAPAELAALLARLNQVLMDHR